MTNVRTAINGLKAQQESLKEEIEALDSQIKEMGVQNYEIEQTKLSLEHQEKLIQQKIANISKQEKAKLDEIQRLKASLPGGHEPSDSLTVMSIDADEKYDTILDNLKEAQEKANQKDMMYEEVTKRLVHIEQNLQRMNKRAEDKEAEANKLEESFKEVNSQVENFKSKDVEDDSDLSEQVAKLQRQLDEAIRAAETAERQGTACDQSIANTKNLLQKQRADNDKIRKEMENMNASLEALEP